MPCSGEDPGRVECPDSANQRYAARLHCILNELLMFFHRYVTIDRGSLRARMVAAAAASPIGTHTSNCMIGEASSTVACASAVTAHTTAQVGA